jgi:hypothetical protein
MPLKSAPMDFRIRGNVRTVGPNRFYVTVSAFQDVDDDRTGDVETGEATTREAAIALRDQLIEKVSQRLKSRGHNVVDLKLD